MDNLRHLRFSKGISQTTLAKKLSVSRSAICQYESGKREPDYQTLQKLADFFGVSVDYLLGRDEAKPSKGKWINVYGEIAAGIPIEAVEDIIDQEEISLDMAASGEYIALQVKGSSMEPRIRDKDVVIIRLQEDVKNGEIAAVFVNGNSVTLKQIKKDENGIWLIPFNAAYNSQFYSKKECEELPIRILGKAVEIRSKI